ncbi:flavin reductase (DIM6/NTAB) family NADH-FMN oxidoreductase RutF [Micromonospora pisi]|uniref:Flavin reductase (DIM6/NTAB) family NADH-FMN oxidoreductase RutF n=1 Tax=Micromonospora pisi TaxID=589240 RepID=A0A495JDB2_9ACTN|nr:flavin reductase family protein [Micromonospora pisi]RKR86907.1 flavin reductase (DIM6/NTAB) family NADH-FMN oxidoreductase RutF [Micromonospora pisi]
MSVHAAPYGELADTKALRRAYGTFATGVTVVTVGGDTPHGMTANSFTTVSLDPPLVLVCVDRAAVMHSVLTDAGRFAVSVLGSRQAPIARYFADRHRPLGAEQFDAIDWLPGPVTGAPLLTDALAHFECEVRCAYDGGDHSIFLAHLVSMQRASEDEALLFLRGRFRQLEPERSEVTT